jgi:hypothetical protein
VKRRGLISPLHFAIHSFRNHEVSSLSVETLYKTNFEVSSDSFSFWESFNFMGFTVETSLKRGCYATAKAVYCCDEAIR